MVSIFERKVDTCNMQQDVPWEKPNQQHALGYRLVELPQIYEF
jgi:hypothetical protein